MNSINNYIYSECAVNSKKAWYFKNKHEYLARDIDPLKTEEYREVRTRANKFSLFNGFKTVENSKSIQERFTETNEALREGTGVINACFKFEDLECEVSQVMSNENHHIYLYIDKVNTKLEKETRKNCCRELAYISYVANKLGYIVDGSSVLYLNKDYNRSGDISNEELFVIADVSAEVREMVEDVEDNLDAIRAYMNASEEPKSGFCAECKLDKCPFWSLCSPELPEHNIFDIHLKGSRFTCKKKLELYNAGIISCEDASECTDLKEYLRLIMKYEANDLPAYIDRDAVREFLATLSYPLYFLDFETIAPVIPKYDNSHPNEKICFQYSLHYIEEEGGEFKHKEYLAYPGSDPRRELCERLCEDIPMGVCTLVYNDLFEKGRLNEMAAVYPDLHDHLKDIVDNIVDLEDLFEDKKYYCHGMNGSSSIKVVLPLLFPDDPSLDYHNLEGVHKGDEAMAVFAAMEHMNGEELEQKRHELLEYCKLDTFAMVKIYEKLHEVIS